MKGFQFEIKGPWAHFKRPETGNNPLSHDLMPKTALIGLIGAVLGIERKNMRPLFPVLSEDLLYNIQLLRPIIKEPVGLTSWKAVIKPKNEKAPKRFEMIKNPAFLVTLALYNEKSSLYFIDFVHAVRNGESVYPPVLGIHNCPASLSFLSEGVVSDIKEGEYVTRGFVVANQFVPDITPGRIGFDKLPTFQNDDFWNLPDRYVQVVYPEYPQQLKGRGTYRKYMSETVEECICLI